MSAGVIKEICKERSVIADTCKSDAIPASVRLCAEAKSEHAQKQAAGALLELAKQRECKDEMQSAGAVKDVVGLVKVESVVVQVLAENVCVCVF